MVSFAEKIAALEAEGYANAPARAKLAHDVVLKAMEKCGFAKNITVKGGVVMSGITGDIRRATMDMDVDFVRYGLTDENIDDWIQRLNCLDGIRIVRSSDITDLRHQNYHGKRVYLDITDSAGVAVSTKLDIGVHVHRQMKQKPMRFAIVLDENSATLPANSKEQMFAEKLKSLLKFGIRSNRPKDAFDMYYLIDGLNRTRLRAFVKLLVFDDAQFGSDVDYATSKPHSELGHQHKHDDKHRNDHVKSPLQPRGKVQSAARGVIQDV